MEFWGVEVKIGESVNVKLEENCVLHLTHASLGEPKKYKANESVVLHIKIDGKKLVMGTLHSDRMPQQLFDFAFDKEFKLSHKWKNGCVYFYGYKTAQIKSSQSATESESDDDIPFPIANGKEVKKDEKPEPVKPDVGKASSSGKQKVKVAEPAKDVKPNASDSDDSDDSDDSASESSEYEEDTGDSSDGDDSEDSDSDEEDEETPKKQQSGKRPTDSAVKTLSEGKKPTMATPQKSGKEVKKDEKPGPVKPDAGKVSGSGKQKVKVAEPVKDVRPNASDDSDDSTSGSSESKEDTEDSSYSDDMKDSDSDEEDKETPKQQYGKKRPTNSAIKTPSAGKRPRLATPQKSAGKKGVVHVDAPYPSKKTPAKKSNQKSPASTSGEDHSRKPFNKSFKS